MNIIAATVKEAIGCTQALADLHAPHLAESCAGYDITTPDRMAAYFAQLGHESGSLQYAREIASGAAYEGRADLGNMQPGDGERFRGRGWIQCTGRSNYARARDGLRAKLGEAQVPDFEAWPEAVEQPNWAAWVSAWWWAAHGCNELADAGRYIEIGRLINRGNAAATKPANGEADRIARWERAKQAMGLSGEPTSIPCELPAPTPPPAPIEAPRADVPAEQPTGAVMSKLNDIIDSPLTKFALAAVNPLLAAVPEFLHLFTDKATGQTVPERNVAAVTKIVAVAQQALQDAGHDAPNAQAVAEIVSSDPVAKAVVRDALMTAYYSIAVSEAGGGGIDGARKANAVYQQPGAPGFWLNPSFWISIVLISMPMMLLVDVFYVHAAAYAGELRTQIVTGVLMVIGMVGGYWIGTSISSARKDDKQQTAPIS